MTAPQAPFPVFDSERPWGTYRPEGRAADAIRFTQRLPGEIRLLYRLAKLVRHRTKYETTTPLDVEVWGLKLRLLTRGNLSESEALFTPQFYDRTEMGWLASRLSPEAVFVDAGANAGLYGFRVHSLFGEAVRTLAVEPDPEMRRRIAFNVATNGVRSLEVRPVALSDHRGRATLATKTTQRGQNRLHDDPFSVPANRVGIEVEVDTLPDLLREAGVNRVDLLKIDVEGHEPRVLGYLFQHTPPELHPRALITERKDDTAGPIRSLLEGHGYRPAGQTRRNWLFER